MKRLSANKRELIQTDYAYEILNNMTDEQLEQYAFDCLMEKLDAMSNKKFLEFIEKHSNDSMD